MDARRRESLDGRVEGDDTARMTERIALAPVLMVQGTASHAGKTTIVAALCRLFARAGYRVAPFKAQNMSNNAAVTMDGGEVGRAQAMQAMAAGVAVTVDMNPILLKPQSDWTSQIVVLGSVRYRDDARAYYDRTAELWPVVTGALDRLRASYDLVIAEGAGSPAEINLERYDVVNMRVARHANAPVLLVGDIDRGGVFAALFGTVKLLPEGDQALIRGFIINKFRGDPSLLDSGFQMLEDRTGIATLGVIPFADLSRVPAEDAVEWASGSTDDEQTLIDVAIIRLPRVANLDEFQPLMSEGGVSVRWIADASQLRQPDLIIIPGTKSTMADLEWMRDRRLDRAIQQRRAAGTPVLGICGGFQMLGSELVDDVGIETRGTVRGLGLLPTIAVFGPEKTTRRVVARINESSALWGSDDIDEPIEGYEIHAGQLVLSELAGPHARPFTVQSATREYADGCTSGDGLVVGTYMHGLLENDALRHAMLQRLARRKGRSFSPSTKSRSPNEAIDALADCVRDSVDMTAIAAMIDRPLVRGTE
jgi:adenosylcobyric acid synthase